MSCPRYRVLLFVVFVIVVASTQNATAIRTMAPEELRGRNKKDPSVDQSVYEKAKEIMASWMERLPSGPSPGGGGGHHR
ncbi:hypothetical protein M5K25_028145 [Dendrobium thyrsiflorum]|uniref:Uncharacterized protein n=1 Tax=Dendrobium thyrsiflorum TaxID=117978 RepID=A0ABD0TVR8_DENTH